MHWLVIKLVSWVVHAAVVMASVAFVSPRNRNNTLGRALLVTFLVALVVTPFAYFWFLLIPGLIALVLWFFVYTFAYDIGTGQAIAVGIVQAVLGVLVDWALGRRLV